VNSKSDLETKASVGLRILSTTGDCSVGLSVLNQSHKQCWRVFKIQVFKILF